MLPLILTLRLDEASFHFFDGLRQRHFPPERNFLKAHLTLFHHLPDTGAVAALLEEAALQLTTGLSLEVTGPMKLGGGVAYRLHNAALAHWHRGLQQQLLPWLTPQDQQPLRAHVTVQNKVSHTVANTLFAQLESEFRPFSATGLGLDLWQYLDGPWGWLRFMPFAAPA